MMDVRYPIGKLRLPTEITSEDVELWISEIEKAPLALKEAIRGLTTEQLSTPYRQGGWKIYQVVHHLADAHMNGYIRIKKGLTEHEPNIMPYNQEDWAELEDNQLPIEVSVDLFSTIQKRLTALLKSLTDIDLKRTVQHPENGLSTIEKLIATYAWHGKHHIAHITSLRKKMGW
ncbi:YfiT family bacillithiol transferase [Heyndrickxia ginsengihumi]|uniref:Putative metal-dependent hydrolase NG54_04415 n=2 Tax=Heyndrickxia ginsengihumi TaxID=363870 RepID=A0A0A6VFE4_9BACI|nr:putative metal-dependent hydrolase [Heyndrickxia ginsengihumi]KHD86281.1 metal-dependent hydrolase [Heyndrickxia ginsengihumi]MCM3024686.1 putative metal-dependent hydrolase [Heyndrickxia ginsengihumi]